MAFELKLSRNSVRNCTIDCDAIGLHYEVSTPIGGWKTNRVTTVKRWDPKSGEAVIIAEWERSWLKSDRIRLSRSGTADFVPIGDVLLRRSWWCLNRSFVGENGSVYVWKTGCGSLKLYVQGADKAEPIAAYHRGRRIFRRTNARLELQTPAREVLDPILN